MSQPTEFMTPRLEHQLVWLWGNCYPDLVDEVGHWETVTAVLEKSLMVYEGQLYDDLYLLHQTAQWRQALALRQIWTDAA